MIFEDPSKRRWRRALIVFSFLVVAAAIALGITIMSAVVLPHAPAPTWAKSRVQATQVRASLEREVAPVYTPKQTRRMQAIRAQEKKRRDKLVGGSKGKSAALPLPQGAVVGFAVNDDPASVASLEKHVANLDVVVPDWFEVPGPGCDLVEHIDEQTARVLGRTSVIVLPRIANLLQDSWRGEEIGQFLANSATRACLIKKLIPRLIALKVGGINLDFEELRPEHSDAFLEFLVELRNQLHAHSMRLTVDVPASHPAFDYEYIGDVADAVMVMAYDEHWPGSESGPVASRGFMMQTLDDLLPRIPLDRLVFVLGSYGYDWTQGETPSATDVSFRSAMDLARAADAKPVFEEGIENGHFGYIDGDEATHEVWFQDALATWNQVQELHRRGVTRVGLWRLGVEDDTVWSFLGSDTAPAHPFPLLAELPPVKSTSVFGEGEVYMMRGEPQSGARELVSSPDGRLIVRGRYSSVPSGYVVERRGGEDKQVTLSYKQGNKYK